jgi:ferric-dicitrate binding protein FerR (iron transport regulator)/opacity protein-like surface antigen
LLLSGVILAQITSAEAAEPCEAVVGELVSVEGQVELQHADAADWQKASLGQSLCQRDTVRVGARSRGTIALINDAILRLDQNTTVHLLEIVREPDEPSLIDLVIGAFQSFSRAPRTLAVSTPYLNATIEGTEFALRVEPQRSLLTVLEGRIAAANEHGQIRVAAGQSAVAEAGKAPAPYVLVQPRDAVQWALYYPPILAALGGQPGQGAPEADDRLTEALALAGRRDVNGALAALERIPEQERDSQYHLYRSAFLLSVGQAAEARSDIDRALAIDPQAGLAYALRAIINVVQNRKDEALVDAEQAVKLSPNETAPKIALSYAQQAHFRLDDARDTLLSATAEQPQDALAWARLSELWLMLGDRHRARESADRGVALAPNLERAQVVRGFANLAEFRTEEAKQDFTRAVALDSADPLPRLGRGLALIHEGALQRGRRELEVAAGLDSGNALLRAYLGKAYFEEKRDPLDAGQFKIAKELDPLDPTAYLYDAIRKQSENSPIEALRDLQASIERNDNRAIYRSRQLLDQDQAARGTSLARIYDDLGFYQLGVNEATQSLSLDPGSAAAHRFLSDTYQGVRRREISRVSELLQAQMLQDVNINPVQPSISETNLNLATRGGPTEAGFNEFTPLFERNDIQFNASGVGGNNDTFGGEGVVSALYDGLSISGGAFHYESDGWRTNNDINHDIYELYAQYAVTPELNVQVEYRHRDTEFGDLEFDFDPDDFLPNLENEFEQDLARIGLRYSPAPHSDILLSYIFAHRDGSSHDVSVEPFVGEFTFDTPIDQDTNQVEGQYIFRSDRFNVLVGAGYSNVDGDESILLALDGFPLVDEQLPFNIDDYRGYVYANINIPEPVTWTVGVNYTDYNEDRDPSNEVSRFNPKVGVEWDVTNDLQLRAAYIETVKPALAANRTLEPTQVAGFNQFFDEANATKSRRYGFGVDWQVTPDLAIGGEMTWRDLEEPFIDADQNRVVDVDANEQLHQAYLYWTPFDELAVRAGFAYDKFDRESEDFLARVGSQDPLKVETISVPVSLSYFHPSGFFAAAGATFVDQDVDRLSQFENQGHDSFFVVDLGVGYRFPNRHGIASLSVQNLLDEGMEFQDDSYREFQEEPSVGPYFPDRTIIGRVTLNF